MCASGSAYQPGKIGLPECRVWFGDEDGGGGEGGRCDGGQLLPPPMMFDCNCDCLISVRSG